MATEAERMAALKRANEVRSRRRQLKIEMAEGRVGLAKPLLSDDPDLHTMLVRDLVLATPGIGSSKAMRALNACRISPTIPLSKTSRKTRTALLSHLARMHPTIELGWRPDQAMGAA